MPVQDAEVRLWWGSGGASGAGVDGVGDGAMACVAGEGVGDGDVQASSAWRPSHPGSASRQAGSGRWLCGSALQMI